MVQSHLNRTHCKQKQQTARIISNIIGQMRTACLRRCTILPSVVVYCIKLLVTATLVLTLTQR